MSASDWLSCACILTTFMIIGAVAIERNRLRQQADNAEGRLTGLSLDLAATRELLGQVQAYLSSYDSWAVDAVAPGELTARSSPSRWSPSRLDRSTGSTEPRVSAPSHEAPPSDEDEQVAVRGSADDAVRRTR